MSKKERVIKLSDEIVSYYQHLFVLIPIAMHIVLHSGRAATKSTFFAMWHLYRLLYYPNADGIIFANEYSSIKDKVFLDFKKAAEILGIPDKHIEFHSTENGTTWIKVKNKYGTNTIFFEHGKGGSEGLKGKRCGPGHRWLFVHYYELTNFISWSPGEVTNNNATFVRNAYGSIKWNEVKKYCEETNNPIPENEKELKRKPWFMKSWEKFMSKEFCICYEFNTPGSGIGSGQWVMDWLEQMKKSNDVYYQFNNYRDMTEEELFKFLGPLMIKEIQNISETDPVTYNHVYLGKSAYDGDIVYPQLNREIHFGKHENFDPDFIVIGVDVGRSDPTVCTVNGFESQNKDLRIALGMHRWSHCNRKAEMFKDGVRLPYKNYDIFEYSNMILEFCEMVHNEYPHAYIYFQMDYANEGKAFYDEMFRFNHPPYLNVNKSWEKVGIEERIDTICTSLTVNGIVKIYDPILYTAFKNQVYGKMGPEGERKRLDDPTKITLDVDSLDSCEYGILRTMFKDIKTRIRTNKGKFIPLFVI